MFSTVIYTNDHFRMLIIEFWAETLYNKIGKTHVILFCYYPIILALKKEVYVVPISELFLRCVLLTNNVQ